MAILGIVSKEAHVKSHAAALEQDGFEIRLLGGSPIAFPMTLDAIIVRIASSSHGGVDQARKYAKTRNIPLVEADGLTGIRTKLRSLFPEVAAPSNQKDSWAMEPPAEEPQAKMDINTKICKSLLDPIDADSEVKNLLGPMLIGSFFKRCAQALEAKMALLPQKKDFWSLWCAMHSNARHDSEDWKVLGAYYDAQKFLSPLNNASRLEIVRFLQNCDNTFPKAFKGLPTPSVAKPLANAAKLYLGVVVMLTEPNTLRRRAVANGYKFLCGSQVDPKSLSYIFEAGSYTFIPRSDALTTAGEHHVEEAFAPKIEHKTDDSDTLEKFDISSVIQEEVLNLGIRLEETEKLASRVNDTDKVLASANQAISRLEAKLGEAMALIQELRAEVSDLKSRPVPKGDGGRMVYENAIALLKSSGAKVVLSYDP